MTPTPITGKIARVDVMTGSVVLNIGASHGVTVGMRFLIGDTAYEDVLDPDTGEVLGRISKTPRYPLTVGRVATRMALCLVGVMALALGDAPVKVGASVMQVMEGIDDLP